MSEQSSVLRRDSELYAIPAAIAAALAVSGMRLHLDGAIVAVVQHDLVSIGMGLTPVVAVDLEKDGKGSVKEIISVVRTFARFRPFTIRLESGARRSFDSLLFANIAEMANYATLIGVRFPERSSARRLRARRCVPNNQSAAIVR